jgi:hypothetical protein
MVVAITGLAVAFIGIALVLVATGSTAVSSSRASSSTSDGTGCITHDDAFVTTTGAVVTVRATATFADCPKTPNPASYITPTEEDQQARRALSAKLEQVPPGSEEQRTLVDDYLTESRQRQLARYNEALAASRQALIGGLAEMKLGSELFKGKIAPISEVDQKIESAEDKATWTWQLTADEPGDYAVPLVLIMRNAQNQEVELRDDSYDVNIKVAPTLAYRAGVLGSMAAGFITSLSGAVTGIVAIIGGTATIVATMRRRKSGDKKGQINEDSAPAPETSSPS